MLISAASVLQTVREVALWELGSRRYTDTWLTSSAIDFAHHRLSVRDDQADRPTGQREFEAVIQPMLDGRPLGPPSRALVRPGVADLGRYHLWLSAWSFRENATGNVTLWLARRLEPVAGATPRFEITTLGQGGDVRTRVVRGWQTAFDYRTYRATQFVRDGTWEALPLALGDIAGLFPLLLAIFPVGTCALGLVLWKKGSTDPSSAAADSTDQLIN